MIGWKIAIALVILVAVWRNGPAEVVFLSTSGVLRADFTSLDIHDKTVITGDEYGGLNLWQETSNHKAQFHYLTRSNTSKAQEDMVVQTTIFSNGTKVLSLTNGSFMLQCHQVSATNLTLLWGVPTDAIRFAVSNDSKLLFTVNGKSLQVWSLENGKPIKIFSNDTADAASYRNLDASPDGKYVAAGNRDRFHLFNLTEDRKLQWLNSVNQLKSDQQYFNARFTPNDTHLLTSNGVYLMHWQYNDTTLRIRSNSKLTGPVTTLTVSQNGKYAACNSKGNLDFYELVKFQLQGQKEGGFPYVAEMKHTADSTYLFAASGNSLTIINVDYTAQNSSECIKSSFEFYQPSNNHFGPVHTISTQKGGLVVSTSSDLQNFKFWKLKGGALELILTETIRRPGIFITPPLKLTASDISPNGLHVVTAGSYPFDLIMFTINGTKLIDKFRTNDNNSHMAQVTAVRWNKQSTHVISSGLDQKLLIWQLFQKKELRVLGMNVQVRPPTTNMILAGNSSFIICSHLKNDNQTTTNLSLWRVDYAKNHIVLVNETRSSEAHESDIESMAISPDEKFLASLGYNGELKFWRLQNFTMIDQLMYFPLGSSGSLHFTSDGRFLMVSQLKYNTLFRYGMTGLLLESQVARTFNPSDPYSSNEDPDSKQIIVGNADGSLQVHEIR